MHNPVCVCVCEWGEGMGQEPVEGGEAGAEERWLPLSQASAREAWAAPSSPWGRE